MAKNKDFIKYEEEGNNEISVQLTYLTGDTDGVLAYGQLTFSDYVAVKVSLWHTTDGNDFFSFPSRKGKDGNYYNDVIPMSKDTASDIRELAESCVEWCIDNAGDNKKKKNKR